MITLLHIQKNDIYTLINNKKIMKKLVSTITLLFLTVTLTAQIQAPQPSPMAKVNQTVGLTEVTLEYSRPAMKGREIFGELVPFETLWRTGANANSIITFSDDVVFAGNKVAAGSYAIYTKPSKKKWEVILYNETTNWGTPKSWDESKIVATATAETNKIKNKAESFTIAINELSMEGAHLQILWDDTMVAVPFTVPTATKTQASIDKIMAGPSANDYYSAATFYLDTDKNLQQAHEWISKAVDTNPGAYWMHRKKSLIEAKMGNKTAAIATAKTSLSLAEKAGNMDYVKLNTDSLKEWGVKM